MPVVWQGHRLDVRALRAFRKSRGISRQWNAAFDDGTRTMSYHQ